MQPTLIIAEAGVNHNGDLNLAKELIAAAAMAGADYVKFQTFKAEKIVSKKAKQAEYQVKNIGESSGQFEMLKKLELDVDAHHILMEEADRLGIKFLSTAFDLDSIDLLAELDLGLWKIPSGEITNLPYLRKIAFQQEPTVISTGMSTLEEVGAAIEILLAHGASREKLWVLHCNTEYPTPMKDVHLRAMYQIQETFGIKVGYSDHTLGIEVPVAAVAMGATCIEKHFTLDRNMQGPDHKASLEPDELNQMISMIRNIELALGEKEKKPSPSEKKNITIVRKSIHLKHDLPAGTSLTAEDLIMLRPGDGISPMKLEDLLGKELRHPLKSGHKLAIQDFS
ncbi:MAG: N-acetylneuraminate synthase [Bacteroidia bacterium]|nr:N-acetylneuraminate synthase [Bacteroidia bacterium]